MMKRVCCILIILIPWYVAAQVSPVTIQHTPKRTRIVLSRSIQKAIHLFDSSFVPLSAEDYIKVLREKKYQGHENYLSLCTGDFDGNRFVDAVLLGRSGGGMRMIAALQQKKNLFLIVSVKEFPLFESGEEDAYLTKVPARVLNVTSENRTISFSTDTFLLTYYRRGSILYHWEKNEFVQYQLVN
jgi:hypothetical protein